MSKIYGIALNKQGDPVADVEVELKNPTGSSERFTTGSDGIFEHEATPGTWSISWTSAGTEGEGTVDVAEGEDAEVELEVG